MTRRATMYAMERALIRCAKALENEVSAMADADHPMSKDHAEAAQQARDAVALFRRDGPKGGE